MKRTAGILMPIFSLPGAYGIGCFSKEAYKFIDFLEATGQKYWQILPLNPIGKGYSPYQSISAFAGENLFIDIEQLVEEELLEPKVLNTLKHKYFKVKTVDYPKVIRSRKKLFRMAYKTFLQQSESLQEDFRKFMKKEAAWLKPYALFCYLQDKEKKEFYWEWQEKFQRYSQNLWVELEKTDKKSIYYYIFLQYLFFKQWHKLKSYAHKKNVAIIGDMPIYVAENSVEMWSEPDLFLKNKAGKLDFVAGCPPDAFSKDGQLWENPLYDWTYHKKEQFAWWKKRIASSLKMFDVVRLDHFRGFEAYYAIPIKDINAKRGAWHKGPGEQLFEALNLGEEFQIIAEDLGTLTPEVGELRQQFKFPGMKVLEFGFESLNASDHLPHQYKRDAVVYTGTHDNMPLESWYKSLPEPLKQRALDYLGFQALPLRRVKFQRTEITFSFIRLALASVAHLAIIPLWDYLSLGDEARINTPSVVGGNWQWRMTKMQLTEDLEVKIFEMMKLYERYKVK